MWWTVLAGLNTHGQRVRCDPAEPVIDGDYDVIVAVLRGAARRSPSEHAVREFRSVRQRVRGEGEFVPIWVGRFDRDDERLALLDIPRREGLQDRVAVRRIIKCDRHRLFDLGTGGVVRGDRKHGVLGKPGRGQLDHQSGVDARRTSQNSSPTGQTLHSPGDRLAVGIGGRRLDLDDILPCHRHFGGDGVEDGLTVDVEHDEGDGDFGRLDLGVGRVFAVSRPYGDEIGAIAVEVDARPPDLAGGVIVRDLVVVGGHLDEDVVAVRIGGGDGQNPVVGLSLLGSVQEPRHVDGWRKVGDLARHEDGVGLRAQFTVVDRPSDDELLPRHIGRGGEGEGLDEVPGVERLVRGVERADRGIQVRVDGAS